MADTPAVPDMRLELVPISSVRCVTGRKRSTSRSDSGICTIPRSQTRSALYS